MHKKTTHWNGKKFAVVPTYEDALNIHLDKVIPARQSFYLQGPFYLIVSATIATKRVPEWLLVSKKG